MVVIEEMEKVLDTNTDIAFEFLKDSHEVVINLLKQAVKENKKLYFDFIKQALDAFTLIEYRLVTFAATDIIAALQRQNLLGCSSNQEAKKRNYTKHMNAIRDTSESGSSLLKMGHSETKKILPEKISQKELSTRHGLDNAVLSNVIGTFSKDWKTGQRMYSGTVNFNQITAIEDAYKDFNTSQIIHTLLGVSLLGEDSLLSEVIQQLKRISSYEGLLYIELNKLTIVHDAPSLKKTSDIVRTTFRLYEIAREVSFCKDNAITLDNLKIKELLDEILNHCWSLFFILYDPSKHFRYSSFSQDPEQRFKDAFIDSKTEQWDTCFTINENAINRPFQKIFNILKTSRALLKTLSWVLDKKTGFDESQETHTHVIRLIIITIRAFVNNNAENQGVCSTTQDFIRLFYVQTFVNQAADGLLMFNDMMKGNKKLLKLPLKYLYDVSLSTFVGKLSDPINNTMLNSYLSAAIISFDYLAKSALTTDIFDPIDILREKWGQISQVEAFTSLNVLKLSNDVSSLPHCYYAIRETMAVTLRMLDRFDDEPRKINDIKVFLSFSKWLSFFESENYLLQYELKNLVTRCISKIYFESGKKGRFTQNFEETVTIISSLICELLFFRMYVSIKGKQSSNILNDLANKPSFITSHEQYNKVNRLYTANPEIKFESKKLKINMEEISIHDLFYEYIYGGCLDLLFHILLNEVDTCKQSVDRGSDTKSIMDFILLLLEEIIQFEGLNDKFPYHKVETFLNSANVTKGYEDYKQRIVNLTNKLMANKKVKGRHISMMMATLGEKVSNTGIEVTPLDTFNQHLDVLRKNKKQLKEENIKELADEIADHPQSSKIIAGIVKYLKRDLSKVNIQEIKFLLKLLRKFIERENTNNPDEEPVYNWKDVSLADLKKISKIQQNLKELGLTQILYNFFGLSNPKITKETLLLSLAYMYGGNRDIQTQFFEQLTDDDENKVIDEFGKKLTSCWALFRAKENERMQYLTGGVQRNLFEFFKGKSAKSLNDNDLQLMAFETGIDLKYLESANVHDGNQLFMLILTFFQSLCEGQYTDMQNYLRDQTWNGRTYPNSFDLIGFLRHNINSYHKVLNRYNLDVGEKVLGLITELIQGEVQTNITIFLNKSFIYDMCRIVTDYNSRYHLLPRGFGLDQFHEEFREIKSQVIFVFKTMVENRSETNVNLITNHIDVQGLMKTFVNIMRAFITKKNLHKKVNNINGFVSGLSNKDFKDILGDAINIYIIFKYIYDDPIKFNDKMKELITEMSIEDQELLGMLLLIFKRLVTSIEIIADSKAEPLMRIWFPILAVCNFINEEAQTSFLNKVDRSNSQTKISALVDATEEIIPQIYTEYLARKKVLGLNYNKLYSQIRLLTNLIGLTITFLNIGTYHFDSSDGNTIQEDVYQRTEKALNIVQIILSASLFILWIFLFRKRHQSIMWERYIDENVKSIGFLPLTIKNKIDDGNVDELTKTECNYVMMLKGANSDEFKDMRQNAPSFKGIYYSFLLLDAYFTINSSTLLWHLIYVGITIGSLFHPIVAIFQIFDIAIRSDTIKQVYSAISKNVNQFLWTLFLLVVVNIVYSSIGFFFLNTAFISGDDVLCETAFACFMNTLNLGLRSGGGIGDAIGPQPYNGGSVGLFVGRIIFDISFFIIMIILLLNLIFGMIIDAFGELRDQKSSDLDDQQNVCFICGIERSEFERHTNFDVHISDDHNLWAYVHYIIYLIDRQKTAKVDMTDIENLVLEKYLQKDIGWIPIGKSLTLERIYAQEKLDKENELDKLTNKVDAMQKNMKENETRTAIKMEQIQSLLHSLLKSVNQKS